MFLFSKKVGEKKGFRECVNKICVTTITAYTPMPKNIISFNKTLFSTKYPGIRLHYLAENVILRNHFHKK
jgi:hypothetical protein